MKKWQKYWLLGVIIFYSIHLARDIMQDTGIHNFLSDSLVKKDSSKTPLWYWQIFNTYTLEVAQMTLALFSFKNKKFGFSGVMTIFLSLFFLSVWLIYWILL